MISALRMAGAQLQPWPTLMLKQRVSHQSSARSGVSVLAAAQTERRAKPCKTTRRAKRHIGFFFFFYFRPQQLIHRKSIFIFFILFFFTVLSCLCANAAAATDHNNLLVTFRLELQCGVAVYNKAACMKSDQCHDAGRGGASRTRVHHCIFIIRNLY